MGGKNFGLVLAPLAGALCCLFAAGCGAQPLANSVTTYHDDSARSGNFIVPALNDATAARVHLDGNFRAEAAGHVYAQPLYWHPPGSASGMLIVATEDDVVQAFDGVSGKELWRRTLGEPVRRSELPCGNIDPLGVTGAPVIDPASGTVYLDAMVRGPSGPSHRVFGLSLKTGSVLPGWPVEIAAALAPATFEPRVQNERGALTLLDGSIYVPFGGHAGDCGPYHGWVVGISLADPHKVTHFVTRARAGGIWTPGGMSSDGRSLFVATGNTFDTGDTWGDGEAVFRLDPDLRHPTDERDYFTPSDWRELDAHDLDLSGSDPVLLDLPRAGGGTEPVVLALGKDGKAYLLDRNDLGGVGGQLAVESVSTTRIISAPATYPMGSERLVAFNGPGAHCPTNATGLTVLKIGAGAPPSIATAWCAALTGRGSPIVTTTDGHSNPIVWVLGAEGDNRLHGFRGDDGAPLFTSEPLAGLRHFQTLIATRDRIYVAADDRVYAFAF